MQWESASWLLKMAIGPKFAVRFMHIFKFIFIAFLASAFVSDIKLGLTIHRLLPAPCIRVIFVNPYTTTESHKPDPLPPARLSLSLLSMIKLKDIAAYIQTVARPTHIQANRAQNLGQTCL